MPNVDEGLEPAQINGVETKFTLAKRLISNLREELDNLDRLLASDSEPADIEELACRRLVLRDEMAMSGVDPKIIEGVFDGQNMVGSDGRQYIVPQNYASKSKLVEGDILKLTIQPSGTFMFKQIGPIERDRIIGMLIRDENTQEWKVVADGRKYCVLPASISYYKGEAGDDAVVLIPKSAPSRWAAVENIIRRD